MSRSQLSGCEEVPNVYFGRCRSVELFQKLNRLGEGTYGTVYRARDKENNQIVALKKVRIHNAKDGFPRSSLREIRLLKLLRHPNIVQFLEVVCGEKLGSIFLVFEYCEHDVGALLDLMERRFSQAEIKCLIMQLLQAVAHLHSCFVIHRDIKLSNLLLTNRGVLKLADFGLAREFMEPPHPCTTNVVTLWYRAPELLFGAHIYTVAVDNWSIGCNLGELLGHKPLLPGKSEEHQIHLICELLGTPSVKIWPDLAMLNHFNSFVLPTCEYNNLRVRFPDATENCLDLLNKLLTFDPAKRVGAVASLQHAYFSESPAPQELHWMPTWKEHRNEVANPRANAPAGHAVKGQAKSSAAKRPVALPPRSALFAAAKKLKSSVF